MKVAIHQPHYLPWLGYFAKWAAADLFVFLDTVQYEKNGWQNRNRIKTPDGPRWLTVPVQRPSGHGRSATCPIDTTQTWRARHLRAIENAYARRPGGRGIATSSSASTRREWERLAPLAVDSAQWLAGALGVTTPTRLASELGVADGPRQDATARLVALCRAVGADTYLAGPGRRPLHRRRRSSRPPGSRSRRSGTSTPCTPRDHGEFAPFLSALDLLLMHGDEALGILCEGNTWSPLSPEPR